jgi:hypothetical protein
MTLQKPGMTRLPDTRTSFSLIRDRHHSAGKKTGLTKSCGIDQMKHFIRCVWYRTRPILGIREKFGGYCDPAAGLLLLRPMTHHPHPLVIPNLFQDPARLATDTHDCHSG